MTKYQKIDNIFNYDNQNKALLSYNYDYFKNLYFNVTEKIDGTNIGIVWDGYSVSFQGRTEKSIIPKHLLKYLEDNFKTPEFENKLEQLFGDKEVIIFGEGYGFKIQNNGYLKDEKLGFISFDIMVENVFLSYENFCDVVNKLNIKKVPFLGIMTLEETLDYVKENRESVLSEYQDTKMEGVVCKPLIDLYFKYNKRVVFKVKYCDVLKK